MKTRSFFTRNELIALTEGIRNNELITSLDPLDDSLYCWVEYHYDNLSSGANDDKAYTRKFTNLYRKVRQHRIDNGKEVDPLKVLHSLPD